MSNKVSKKGRNPAVVDNWLDTLGLYRKNVAYDETCLFRAASEQIFDCQVYHERVRKECVDYARAHFEEFSHLVDCPNQWNHHLDLLEKHMVVCGNLEIHIISRKYNCDVRVFDASRQQLFDITKRDLPNCLLFCLMDEDHYDVVYKRDHIQAAGFCQSIVYKLLYEDVFHIKNTDDIVNSMLYEKTIVPPVDADDEKRERKSEMDSKSPLPLAKILGNEEDAQTTPMNLAPFPFKVAKALDPTIYRNIEYDSWGEVRRELRLGDWYYGDDHLILGTKCILNDVIKDETYDCYIQEIIKDRNQCVVYLTKLAEKRIVNYTDLSPENDAKPWPLPYRFSKNLVIGSETPPDKLPKSSKKRKDKRRTKSCSESSPASLSVPLSENIESVNAYVGIPLQMSNSTESNFPNETSTVEVAVEQIQEPQELVMSPEAPPPSNNRYQWEQPQWHYMPPTPDPFVWPQSPVTPPGLFNFNVKPMVVSAPVTPNVIPYHDPNIPFYYNYHVEPYQTYNNPWSCQTPDYIPNQNQQSLLDKSQEEPKSSKAQTNELSHNQYNQTNTEMYENSMDRPTVCTTMVPSTPPVEMYSPMVPIHPGTPVIYASSSEMTEMMMPPPPIAVYNSPPMDMHYMSPGSFVYPPTPPAAWYPAGINSQGFIFPPVANAQQNMPK